MAASGGMRHLGRERSPSQCKHAVGAASDRRAGLRASPKTRLSPIAGRTLRRASERFAYAKSRPHACRPGVGPPPARGRSKHRQRAIRKRLVCASSRQRDRPSSSRRVMPSSPLHSSGPTPSGRSLLRIAIVERPSGFRRTRPLRFGESASAGRAGRRRSGRSLRVGRCARIRTGLTKLGAPALAGIRHVGRELVRRSRRRQQRTCPTRNSQA